MRLAILKAMAAGALALGLTATTAHATLIELDLNTAGDKLITLDTVTGLEWLDVDQTLGQSYNTAEGSVFVSSQGFRHANLDEVSALYTNVGVTNQSGFLVPTNFAGAQELLAKLGSTFTTGTGDISFQFGIADFVPFDPLVAGLVHLQSNIPSFLAQAIIPSLAFLKTRFSPRVGNYLLRLAPPPTSVSEPPSWALFVGGLTAWAGFRRRRRNG